MSRTELPESGPGSIAPAAIRLGAFVIDAVASGLVAGLFTAPELPRNRSLLVFAVAYFTFTVLVQQTFGMKLLRMRVVRVDKPVPVGAWRAAVRTLGVVLFLPAVIRNGEGRALHDQLTQTAVVRS